MEVLFKHTFSRDVMNYLESLAKEIQQLASQQADGYILGMLKYVIECMNIEDKQRFSEFLHRTLPKSLEQEAMTLAQIWQNEGFQQGMQQGVRQGMQEGKYDLLLRLLERKFKEVPENQRQQLAKADTEMLLYWGERVLEANTLDEVFE